jgi:hypothetical protein
MSYQAVGGSSHINSVARALGWFSLALGVAELLAPRSTAKAAGVARRTMLVRAYGVRELACGVGLLATEKPSPFLLARVAGDIVDLLTVATARDRGGHRSRAALTAVSLACVTLVDAYAAQACPRAKSGRAHGRTLISRDDTARSGFPRPPSEMRGAARSASDAHRDAAEFSGDTP